MNEDQYQNQTPQNGSPVPGQQPNQGPQGGYYPPPPPQYPRYAQQPPSKPRWVWPTIIGGGCLLLVILFILAVGAIVGGSSAMQRGSHIALIRVDGVITGGQSGGSVFGGSGAGSEDLISQLEKARKDDDAKAIVIRINSPGGSAAGSEEVYNEIMRIRKEGKPVYTSMGDVAASGGYFIASACDKIYADTSTLTGSIGVIFETTDISGLYKKLGINPEVVKSGKFKDIGSPNRALTPDERALLQGMINDVYLNFVESVSKGRKIPFANVKKIADGRVFTGRQAKKLKLVDEIGGLQDTLSAAAKAGGIEGEPKVATYGKKGILGNLFSDDGDSSSHVDKIVGRAVIEMLAERNSHKAGM